MIDEESVKKAEDLMRKYERELGKVFWRAFINVLVTGER